jgi:MFS family permease
VAFELTGESKWTAGILAAQILPTFFFGAWGGVIADRLPKRTVIICTQSAFLMLALLLAGLGYAGVITAWQLVVVTAAAGVVQAIDLPARLAFVMDLAGREDLMNAVALNSLLFNVARALGPAVGGQLMHWIRPEACFLANALSYVAVLWALARMDILGLSKVPVTGPVLRTLGEGLRYVIASRQLLFLVLVMAAISFCGWPSQALLPALAKQNLRSDELGYGWMVSGTGAGALLAAWAIATFGTMEKRRQLMGAGIAFVGAGLMLLSIVGNLALAIGCSTLIGFGLILFLTTSQTIVQLNAGDHNRGRVMAIWAMVQSGAVPLGGLLAGKAADRWGVPDVMLVLGLGCISSAALLFAVFRLAKLHQARAADISVTPR